MDPLLPQTQKIVDFLPLEDQHHLQSQIDTISTQIESILTPSGSASPLPSSEEYLHNLRLGSPQLSSRFDSLLSQDQTQTLQDLLTHFPPDQKKIILEKIIESSYSQLALVKDPNCVPTNTFPVMKLCEWSGEEQESFPLPQQGHVLEINSSCSNLSKNDLSLRFQRLKNTKGIQFFDTLFQDFSQDEIQSSLWYVSEVESSQIALHKWAHTPKELLGNIHACFQKLQHLTIANHSASTPHTYQMLQFLVSKTPQLSSLQISEDLLLEMSESQLCQFCQALPCLASIVIITQKNTLDPDLFVRITKYWNKLKYIDLAPVSLFDTSDQTLTTLASQLTSLRGLRLKIPSHDISHKFILLEDAFPHLTNLTLSGSSHQQNNLKYARFFAKIGPKLKYLQFRSLILPKDRTWLQELAIHLKNLHSFELSNTQLGKLSLEELKAFLSPLSGLRHLSINSAGNCIEEMSTESARFLFSNFPHLDSLDLSYNDLSKWKEDQLQALSNIPPCQIRLEFCQLASFTQNRLELLATALAKHKTVILGNIQSFLAQASPNNLETFFLPLVGLTNLSISGPNQDRLKTLVPKISHLLQQNDYE